MAVRVEGSGGGPGTVSGGLSSCCMDRGNCSTREAWRPYGNGEVGLLYVDAQPLGHTDQQQRPVTRTSEQTTRPQGVPRSERVGFNLIAGEGNVQHSPPTIRACHAGALRVCP